MTKTNSQTASNNQLDPNQNVIKNIRSASNDRSAKPPESLRDKFNIMFESNEKLKHLNLIKCFDDPKQQPNQARSNNNLLKSNPSSLSSNSLSGNSIQFDSNNNYLKIDSQGRMSMHIPRAKEKENSNLNVNSPRQEQQRSSSKTALNANSNSIEINNNSNKDTVKYGELIVLGYNGCINNHPASLFSMNDNKANTNANLFNNLNNFNSTRRKSKFVLKARDKPNGVKPAQQHNCQSSLEVNVCQFFKLFFFVIKKFKI